MRRRRLCVGRPLSPKGATYHSPGQRPRTDWKRIDRLADKQIDFSDTPELTPERFARAVVRRGLKPVTRKKPLTIRIDSDVLEWYRRQGPGCQTRINALLRAYMQERARRAPR